MKAVAALLGGALLVTARPGFSTQPQLGPEVPVWQVAELSFASTATYKNPYQQVDVDVDFSGPRGVTIRRPAFWDGGRIWKVRFSPTELGIWTFTTKATTRSGASPGLDKQRGTVTAVPYAGSAPICRHGFLADSKNGHGLVYHDHTPFWWMSDVLSPADYLRIDSSNKSDWTPAVEHPNSQAFGILDRRVDEKFTAIVYWFEHPWTYTSVFASPGDMIDVDTFRTKFDPLIAQTAKDGLVSVLNIGYAVNVLDDRRQPGVDKMKRYARYLIARYGAYPVVWTANEPDSTAGFPQPETEDRWGEILAYAASLDDYKQPIGPWYRQTAIPGEQFPTAYLRSKWISLIITQCGSIPRSAVFDFYSQNYSAIPLVEAGGCGYEGFRTANHGFVTDDIVRRNAWLAVQEGSGGFGYGVDGVWCPNWDGTSENNMCPNVARRNTENLAAWYRAIDAPGGREMSYLTAFYLALPWQELESPPRDRSILSQSDGSPVDSDSIVARANPSRSYVVVYVPMESRYLQEDADVVLSGLCYSEYSVFWFDPRTGRYASITPAAKPSGARREWTLPKRPSRLDWTLLLKANLSSPVQKPSCVTQCCRQLEPK